MPEDFLSGPLVDPVADAEGLPRLAEGVPADCPGLDVDLENPLVRGLQNHLPSLRSGIGSLSRSGETCPLCPIFVPFAWGSSGCPLCLILVPFRRQRVDDAPPSRAHSAQ